MIASKNTMIFCYIRFKGITSFEEIYHPKKD